MTTTKETNVIVLIAMLGIVAGWTIALLVH
jgi:hypothetical protein